MKCMLRRPSAHGTGKTGSGSSGSRLHGLATWAASLLAVWGAGCSSTGDIIDRNTAPTATIDSPVTGAVYKPGISIPLLGSVSDSQTRDASELLVTWQISGTLTSGGTAYADTIPATASPEGLVNTSLTDGLPEGTFVITLKADDGKLSGTDSTSVSAQNQACSLSVSYPVSGFIVDPGQQITFKGLARDPDTDDPPETLRVRLSDSTEPTLYYVPGTPLSDGSWTVPVIFKVPGTHNVMVVGNDSAGKQCQVGPLLINVNECDNNDKDGDGMTNCEGDCDDNNPDIGSDRPEVCLDGLDNNCDGLVDTGWDEDRDGYELCDPVAPDCNDADPNVHPGASEGCNGIDNNCDGTPNTNELDSDGDGFRVCSGDCDDNDSRSYPNAPEVCDGKDNNCDGNLPTSERDADFDGVKACADGDIPADCDDTNPAVSPVLAEDCNDVIDNNCNGQINEDFDGDKDGYTTCTDCDDTNAQVYPGAAEGVPDPAYGGLPTCDGIDNDCDGVIDDTATCTDDDGDGLNDLGGDCDDFQYYTYPGAVERPDLQDNDCNGSAEGSVLNLSRAHVRLSGDLPSGNLGAALGSDSKDVNGDGIGDLLIGAPSYDVQFQPSQNRGAAFLFFGRDSGWKDVESTRAVDSSILLYEEEPSARAGTSVAMAGDLDQDGYDDLAVGAPYHSNAAASYIGIVYVIFGKSAGWGRGSLLASSYATIEGITLLPNSSNTLLGKSLAGGADITGDGYDDLVLGAPWCSQSGSSGWIMVVPGRPLSSWPAKVKPTDLVRVQGSPGRCIGEAVAIAGYNNEDGIADVIVGTQYDVTTGSGSAAWVPGDPSYAQLNSQWLLDSSRSQEYYGTTPYDYVGSSVSGSADIDNDGYDELFAGRKNASSSPYMAYITFGRSQMPDSGTIDSRADLRITLGADGKDECPCTVQGLADFNGDGYGDFAVGVSRNDASAKDAGKIYIFYGKKSRSGWANSFPTDISLDKADLKVLGERADDQSGSALGAGDINRDGRTDLLIGAPRWDELNSDGSMKVENAGRAYVLFGTPKGRNPVPN